MLERIKDGALLLLISGRLIVMREGVEVLALTTTNRIADGQPNSSNGVMAARDAALRGLRTSLVEHSDFGATTI